MIDLFCIFTTGGLILWSKSFVTGDFSSILNDLIKTILMDEKRTQDYYMPVKGNGIILRWRILNESGLIFVVAYQQSFNVLYTDKLLDLIMKDFITNQLPSLKFSGNIFYTLPETKEYNKTFISLLNKWENYCKFEVENKKGNQNGNFKSNTVTPGKDSSIKSDIIGGSKGSTPTPLPGVGGQNFVLRRKNPGMNNHNKKKDEKKNKNKKEGRKWDNEEGKVDEKTMSKYDQSAQENLELKKAKTVENIKNNFLGPDDNPDFLDDSNFDLIDQDKNKSSGIFGKFTSASKNY